MGHQAEVNTVFLAQLGVKWDVGVGEAEKLEQHGQAAAE